MGETDTNSIMQFLLRMKQDITHKLDDNNKNMTQHFTQVKEGVDKMNNKINQLKNEVSDTIKESSKSIIVRNDTNIGNGSSKKVSSDLVIIKESKNVIVEISKLEVTVRDETLIDFDTDVSAEVETISHVVEISRPIEETVNDVIVGEDTQLYIEEINTNLVGSTPINDIKVDEDVRHKEMMEKLDRELGIHTLSYKYRRDRRWIKLFRKRHIIFQGQGSKPYNNKVLRNTKRGYKNKKRKTIQGQYTMRYPKHKHSKQGRESQNRPTRTYTKTDKKQKSLTSQYINTKYKLKKGRMKINKRVVNKNKRARSKKIVRPKYRSTIEVKDRMWVSSVSDLFSTTQLIWKAVRFKNPMPVQHNICYLFNSAWCNRPTATFHTNA